MKTQFLNVLLSEKEQHFITSVIVELACDDSKTSISEEDVLHRILEMAESHNKLKDIKRTLRKGVQNIKTSKHHCKGKDFAEGTYAKGFLDCAELIKDIVN